MFEQAVFDVQSYDVTVSVDPKTKSITGTTLMTAKTVIPTNVIVLDLDIPYTISQLTEGGHEVKYERKEGKIWIWFPLTKQVGDEIKTSISYSGTPRVAPNPPWIGGFIWAKTKSGADWISVALQNDGADLLFPVQGPPVRQTGDRGDAHYGPRSADGGRAGQTGERQEERGRHLDLQLADDKPDRELLARL